MEGLYLHDRLVKQVSQRSGLGHVIKGYKPILVLIKGIPCVCFSLMILIKQKALKILNMDLKVFLNLKSMIKHIRSRKQYSCTTSVT